MFWRIAIFTQPLPFVDAFVEELAASLKQLNTGRGLSFAQRSWLKFCLMGVLMTNSVCWAGFERIGLGGYRLGAKSTAIMKLLQSGQANPHWTLPSRMGDNPMAWLIQVDGFIVDARRAPREIQEEAFRRGLIPYLP